MCGKGADAAAVTSLARYTCAPPPSTTPTRPRSWAPSTPCSTRVPGRQPALLHRRRSACSPPTATAASSSALASGGHPPPLLLRADGTAPYLPTPAASSIGVWPDADFATTTVRLAPGDTLLLYTDGLTEARAPGGNGTGRYGDEALSALATNLAPTSADAAITTIIALLDRLGTGVEDDTAVLALGVRAKGACTSDEDLATSRPWHRIASGTE